MSKWRLFHRKLCYIADVLRDKASFAAALVLALAAVGLVIFTKRFVSM